MAFLGGVSVCLSGCAALLLGTGVAGGYAISKDSIKNHFDRSPNELYRISRDVIGQMGLVTSEDHRRHRIEAEVEGVNVTITVTPVSEQTTELKVRARKLLLPKIDVAQAVYNRILSRLD